MHATTLFFFSITSIIPFLYKNRRNKSLYCSAVRRARMKKSFSQNKKPFPGGTTLHLINSKNQSTNNTHYDKLPFPLLNLIDLFHQLKNHHPQKNHRDDNNLDITAHYPFSSLLLPIFMLDFPGLIFRMLLHRIPPMIVDIRVDHPFLYPSISE